MKQSLHMKMGQQLAMTPQLQQAIKLLQLSTLELQTEIQDALENNPMLEVQEEEGSDSRSEEERNEEKKEEEKSAPDMDATAMEFSAEDSGVMPETMPEDLPVDSAWEDVYEASAAPVSSSTGSGDGEHRDFTEFHNSGVSSIQDHLNEQIRLAPLSDRDMLIAETLIDAIDDNGYLIDELDLIIDGLNRAINDPDYTIETDEVETVLHMVQHLDPPGCGARDASECMHIQLSQMPETELVENDERLREIITLIRTLNPRPGRQIVKDLDQYIVPDVFVKKEKGVWRVELNPDIAPRLGINSLYAGMVKRADKSDDNNFLRNHLQEARWFIKSLQSRNETLLRVGTAIVERQRSFLEYGDEAMKPLVLRDIAEQLSLHESTISRVTTQKYIHTPRGIFEFKYFFSSHVSTANGGECSATAIRAMIRKFIAAEDATKPLSDSKIANTLVAEGIQVARRTVAKYRESMAIPPSNERKRLA